MAYMCQTKKAQIAPVVKKILKKYGVKGTLAVRNHMTLVLNVKSGPIDFIKNYNETTVTLPGGDLMRFSPAHKCLGVNTFWYHEHFSGKAKNFLKEVIQAMNVGNHDNSRIEVDYFDVGWYIDVNIGKWDKAYILEK